MSQVNQVVTCLPGAPLEPRDIEKLTACGISAELAGQALLRRVDSIDGGQLIGRNGGGDHAGVVFPYVWPGDSHVREYRLRLDHPPLEQGRDGELREKQKYLSPPGRGSLLYVVPGTAPEWLNDPGVPVAISEGEKKALSLHGLAWHGLGDSAERPRWLPLGLAGVWNFRGTVGKTNGPDGERRDVKGPIPDLDRIEWKRRRVYVVFDANVWTNESVRAAREVLARELTGRGAEVLYVDVPGAEGVNGVDDLIGRWGPDRVLELFRMARPWNRQPEKTTTTTIKSIAEIPSVLDCASAEVAWVIPGFIAQGTLNVLTSEPGAGKTTVAMSLSVALARGLDFAGIILEKRPVLMLDRENTPGFIADVLKRMHAKDGDGLTIWGGWCPEQAPEPSAEVIQGWVRECDPKPFIVIDSLVAFHGGNENDSTETRAFMNQCRRLADMGATVLILHHSGKAETSQDYRGSSDIKASADACWKLSNIGATNCIERLRLKPFKSRFLVDPEILLRYADGVFTREAGSGSQRRSDAELLEEALKQHPGVTAKEFSETHAPACGVGRNYARNWLDRLAEGGRVRVEKGLRKAKLYTWNDGSEPDGDDDFPF